jgi:thioredoxin-related protein
MLYLLVAVLLLILSPGQGHAQSLAPVVDWSLVAKEARAEKLPVVVIVTGNGCGHCERLRHDLLSDPSTCALLNGKAVARVLPRETGGKITDFDGERVRSRIFLSRYDVFATPTLLFLDAAGRPVAEQLVGYNDEDSYRDLISDRLDQAREELTARDDRTAASVVPSPPRPAP